MTRAPAVTYQIEAVPTFRDLEGRFVKANRELLNIRRDIMRTEGRRFVRLAQEEAPKSPGGTGRFARKIGYKTFVMADAVGFKVHMPQPLGTFIIEGTRPHPISAVNAKALRFFWVRGPQGPGIYFYRSVKHPGTDPNRFMGRASRRWHPGAKVALRQIAIRYIQILQGKVSVRSA